jgi:hypothetical protein
MCRGTNSIEEVESNKTRVIKIRIEALPATGAQEGLGSLSAANGQPIVQFLTASLLMSPPAPTSASVAQINTKSHRLLAGVATGAQERLGGLKSGKKGKRVVQNLTVSLSVSPPVPTSAWAT